MSVTAMAVRDKLRGEIGQAKVRRYWPGKAPEWAEKKEEEEDEDIKTSRTAEPEKVFPAHDETLVLSKDDRRLRRLAKTRADKKEELISTEEEERSRLQEGDEEEMEERRRRLREKLLEKERSEAALLPTVEEVEEVVSEESEYETDSEEEQMGIAMEKPEYKPKSQRDTIAERERLEEEERRLEALEKKKLEERRVETRQIVVEEIRKDGDQTQKNLEEEAEANLADVDTGDERSNKAEEYEAWKGREIARIKKEREEREASYKEKEEIVRVRSMTEEERREWERKNPKPLPPRKQKWRFMQKYYHIKGAFFQDAATHGAEDIFRRDFSAPTGEDKMDKTILPRVMQVKHFGRRGRTKWTHLVNEDTTDWNNKPKGSKKLKDWDVHQGPV